MSEKAILPDKLEELQKKSLVAGLVALGLFLAVPALPLGACAIVAVIGLILYQDLGEELVPKEDRGHIMVFLTGPDGTGIDYTDRQVERVEKILRPLVEDGTITALSTISGRWDPNRGQVDAPLRPATSTGC